MFYETQEMSHKEMVAFCILFGAKVGTEYEVTETDENTFTVLCMEMEEREEIAICRQIEAEVTNED